MISPHRGVIAVAVRCSATWSRPSKHRRNRERIDQAAAWFAAVKYPDPGASLRRRGDHSRAGHCVERVVREDALGSDPTSGDPVGSP